LLIEGKLAEITTAEIREFLSRIQGRNVSLADIRKEFQIASGTKSFDSVRNILFQLAEQKVIRPIGKAQGLYKVVKQVSPVPVFSVERERRPVSNLIFPRDFNSGMEMLFRENIVVREGDLILISGVSNFGKTALCMNFCGENIDAHPVLMGNEYTTTDEEPTPRFLNRLDSMSVNNNGGWVDWVDVDGNDKFTLLPVWDDYAEHIVKNKINIIDWINMETGEHYLIGSVLSGLKRNVGRGNIIAAIQKSEGVNAGRGGQFTKDFADIELLIDRFGESEVLLTIGNVKEYTRSVIGKTYAYSILGGVKIVNFREVKRCPHCHGQGWLKGEKCSECFGNKYLDEEKDNE